MWCCLEEGVYWKKSSLCYSIVYTKVRAVLTVRSTVSGFDLAWFSSLSSSASVSLVFIVTLTPFTSSSSPCRPVWMLYVSGCAPTDYSSIRQRRKSCGARHHVNNTRYRQPLSVSTPTQLLQRLLSAIWASTLTVISPWEPRLHGRLQAALLWYASFAVSAARYQIRCFSHWLCHWYWQS